MKKALKILIAVVVILAVVSAIAIISYTGSDNTESKTLPENISINGVDCSGLTYDEAEKRLTDSRNHSHIQVVGKLGETLDDYTDFGCTYNIRGHLETIKKDNPVAASLSHYLHIPFSVNIAMNVDKCGDDFAKRVKNSEFLKRDGIVETTDAYVDLDDSEFPIVPEVFGNKTDADAYLKDIEHAIAIGQTRFDFDENAYLTLPNVKQDDPELLKYQKFCRKYLNQKISYRLGDDSFTLTARELDSLMKDDLSGNADGKKVSKFVNKLKKKYDIADGLFSFKSLTGKTFKVDIGDHGWIIDAEGETAQLQEDINSHKDVKRAPVFYQKGAGEYSRTLQLGDTYIDVDITKQHAWYFKNGEKKWETDIVTGCRVLGHNTPTGVYDIKSMSRGVTLTSGGNKKSPGYYESYVSYWMPFLGNNYGLHDASWRSSFGGDIYINSGSHGCVNLPPKKAGQLYNKISVGTIVIIHD